MASPLNPALVARTKTSGELIAIFNVVISAGNYATGGIVFTTTFAGKAGFTPRKPTWVDVQGISGYEYRFNYATGALMIFQDSGAAAPMAELAAAATPAAVVADTIRARVCWIATPQLMTS